MKNKFVFLASTGGGLLSRLLSHEIVRQNTLAVIVDRACGAIEVAKKYQVQVDCLLEDSGSSFSKALDKHFSPNGDVIFISFYTRLLTADFLATRKGRVFNCHPSILPACKGLNGFDDTLKSNSMFIGCTLHEVDVGVDSGRSVIQAAMPLDRSISYEQNRSKVFLAQYYSTLQFLIWVSKDRFAIDEKGEWSISEMAYKHSTFSPNLDINFFKNTQIENELV
jgi:phosphoribosylglycinamide formyltransferase-1